MDEEPQKRCQIASTSSFSQNSRFLTRRSICEAAYPALGQSPDAPLPRTSLIPLGDRVHRGRGQAGLFEQFSRLAGKPLNYSCHVACRIVSQTNRCLDMPEDQCKGSKAAIDPSGRLQNVGFRTGVPWLSRQYAARMLDIRSVARPALSDHEVAAEWGKSSRPLLVNNHASALWTILCLAEAKSMKPRSIKRVLLVIRPKAEQ